VLNAPIALESGCEHASARAQDRRGDAANAVILAIIVAVRRKS